MPRPDDALFRDCVDAIRTKEPRAAIQAVCELLHARVPHYSWVGVYVVRGRDLHLAGWDGDAPTEHTVIPLNTGICGWAATTGDVVNVPDVSKDSRYLACFTQTKSELVVPVFSKGDHDTAIGEIDIDSSDLAAFTSADEVFCNRLAVELAPLVEAVRKGDWAPVGH